MVRCLIALGSNLGDRSDTLQNALRELTRLAHVRLLTRSSWHETAPIGGLPGELPEQTPYLNGAALLETDLSAGQLLERLLQIEFHLGRERTEGFLSAYPHGNRLLDSAGLRKGRWSSRTIDLDLLLYGNQCYESVSLQLPHPRMSFRRFVLEPAVEIAGWLPHPTCGSILSRLLWQLNTAGDYVAIVATGVRASARQACQWLAHELILELDCRWWQHEGPIGPFHVPEGTLMYGLHLRDRLQSRSSRPSDTVDGEKLTVREYCDSLQCDIPANLKTDNGQTVAIRADGYHCLRTPHTHPKLVIAWEKRNLIDRMAMLGQNLGQGQARCQPGQNSFIRGAPIIRGALASILTTDSQQALAEALAAIQSVWPVLSCHS
jgi:2-amino-4-hydroxy-6-hydroxymethyldihydropteridine diphosphokinase